MSSLLASDREFAEENMPYVAYAPVALDVSKLLSGWLNTLAFCRVEIRAYTDAGRAGRRGQRGVAGRA
eukprot:scaffold42057_cov66-Phaeocystis_antarctica.AAC.2